MLTNLFQLNPPILGLNNASYNLDSGATGILNRTQFIFDLVNQTWTEIWDQTILDGESFWWLGLITIATQISLIFIISVGFAAFRETDFVRRQEIIYRTLGLALAMVIAFGDNGLLMRTFIGTQRAFETSMVQIMGEIQVSGMRIGEAIDNVSLANVYKAEVDDILQDCRNKGGDAISRCLTDAVPQVEEIVETYGSELPAEHWLVSAVSQIVEFVATARDEDVGAAVGDALGDALGAISLNGPGFTILQSFLAALQTALAMTLEIASLLHASLLPLTVAILFSPWGEPLLQRWLQGGAVLFLIKISYISVIGMAAIALTLSGAEVFAGVPFLFIVSLTGPSLCFYMARGSAVDLANRLSQQTIGAANRVFAAGAQVAGAAATGGGSALARGVITNVLRRSR